MEGGCVIELGGGMKTREGMGAARRPPVCLSVCVSVAHCVFPRSGDRRCVRVCVCAPCPMCVRVKGESQCFCGGGCFERSEGRRGTERRAALQKDGSDGLKVWSSDWQVG